MEEKLTYIGGMKAEVYKYPIHECDVPSERRQALESYRAKRSRWISWLDHDEDHAIWTTLSGMVWTDVSFRTLAQFAIEDPTSALTNTLVAEQLINGHVATQVLAIRRLADNSNGAMSLRNLITDVRRNFPRFTRENYVCYDGLPYDYEAVQQKDMAAKLAAGGGPFWLPTSGPEAWGVSSMAHEHFDTLAGISPNKRSREDRLPIALLDTIEGWLDGSGADELAKWSHAYLAHAGSVESRQRIAAALVTNNKITEAIRTLARITEALSAEVLWAGGRMNTLMPTAQFDQFENLENRVAKDTAKGAARDLWDKLTDERDAYLSDVRDELLRGSQSKETGA